MADKFTVVKTEKETKTVRQLLLTSNAQKVLLTQLAEILKV